MKRNLPLWMFVLGLLLFAAIGIIAGQAVKSPEQKQSEALPPEPTVTSVPVTRGQLRQTLDLSCIVADARTTTLKVEAAGDARKMIVTRQDTSGPQILNTGSLIVEINGRPVFLFPGRIEFYRNLREGTEGPDVLQLQQGLITLGYLDPDSATGFFGPNTLFALQSFYADRGYELLTETVGMNKAPDPIDQNQNQNQNQNETQKQVPEKPIESQTPVSKPFLNTDELFAVEGSSARTNMALPVVGTNITGGSITLGSGDRVLKCSGSEPLLPVGITPGLPVEVNGMPDLTGLVVGSVSQPSSLASATREPDKGTEPDKATSQEAIVVLPNEFEAKNSKYSVRIIERSGPRDTATVPASAVWTRGEKSFVTVTSRDKKDSPVDVPVEVVFSSAGECNIVGKIDIGEEVLIADK